MKLEVFFLGFRFDDFVLLFHLGNCLDDDEENKGDNEERNDGVNEGAPINESRSIVIIDAAMLGVLAKNGGLLGFDNGDGSGIRACVSLSG